MAHSQTPPNRAAIWLLNSHSRLAQVGIGLETILITHDNEIPDLAASRDNTALGYFAASCVVMYLALAPPQKTEEYLDLLMTPKGASHEGTRKIWPTTQPQYYPLDSAPHALIQSLVDFPEQLYSALSLPVHGLTHEEASSVRDAFLAGEDPSELRKRWAHEPNESDPPSRQTGPA
jgi:hypothetical protein